MEPWSARAADRLMDTHRKQMDRMRPIRFSIKQIQAMSDAEIMSIMAGQHSLEGTMYHDTLHLLSTELNRREIQRSSKPHWTTTPGFILSAVAAVASVVAAVVSVVALLKAIELAPQQHQPAAEYSSQPEDLPKQLGQQ